VRGALGIGMTAYGADRPRISVHLAGNLRQVLGADPGAIYWVLDPQARGTFVEHGADEWVYIFDSPGPEAESPDYVENRVRRAIGHDDVRFDVLGISPWIMACQVADRFREGDVFLVGDAAHRLPPTGGLGMNTGIQDVENLAWKLAAVVHGWAGDTLLAGYEAERRPVGMANALHSQRNASAMQTLYRTVESALAGAGLESLDDIELATLLNEQWAHLNSPALQLGYSYAAEGPTASTDRYLPSGAPGRRLPHTWVRHGEQRRAVVDLIDLAGFTVIANGAPEPYRQRAAASPFPVAVVDVAGAVPDEWLRIVDIEATGSAAVVRPDAHVLDTCRSAQAWPLFESRAHAMLSIASQR